MRLADYFHAAADLYPDSAAFVEGGTTISYASAQAMVLRIASALKRDSVNDRPLHVAILSPNDHRICLLQLAINHGDHVWVSLHARNGRKAQMETLKELDCNMLFYHSAFEATAAAIVEARAGELTCICIDRTGSTGPSLADWLGDVGEAPLPPPEDPQGLMMLQPTGGTTGPSKGVAHTHRTMEMCTLSVRRTYAIDRSSIYLAVAPLTHAGGFFALSFLCGGACVVLMTEFAPGDVLDAVSRHAVSHLFLPPTAVYAVLAQCEGKGVDCSSLRALIVGAAPFVPEKFREAVRVFGPVVYELYGQTECLGPVLAKSPANYMLPDGTIDEAVLASAGRPGDSVRVAIMNDAGEILPRGECGEIVVRTSMVMAGYYKRPDETAAVSGFGWHHTTDLGTMDERGYVTIRDRMKDMIISGGFNVYPSEIEAVIASHEAVLDCAVIGVPDSKWGEAVKAVITLKPGREANEEEIIALCKEELGSVKSPKSVEFWPELPRSAVGKILKKDIRARFWADEWRAV